MATTQITNTHILEYPVRLEPDDNGTVMVLFPDFPEAVTYGDDAEEALARAPEALATIIEAYIKDRQRLPTPSEGVPRVGVPALVAVKAQLSQLMIHSQIKKSELAYRLNWHMPQVDRILDVRHGSGLDQLEAAASAMGQRLLVYFEPKTGVSTRRVPGALISRQRRQGTTTEVVTYSNSRSRGVAPHRKKATSRPLQGARKK